jgi:4-diphosphocytidyl-2-C-methyl-D-erythritol kinase
MASTEMTLTLPSFAKINWTLEILGKRPDGYHELRTLLQTVDLADTLHFRQGGAGTVLTCDHPDVPLGEENLISRAVSLFREAVGVQEGLQIEIEKRIPMAGGLGGGSSNAAVTLLALQSLWEISLPPRELFRLASQLGADVPFFLLGGTALGVGRGDEVYPMPELSAPLLLLVNVGLPVPTREVYGSLPSELTMPGPISMMPLSFEVAYGLEGTLRDESPGSKKRVARWLYNDLERAVFPRFPRLREVKESLLTCGASGALLSGSGSSLVAIFDNNPAREEAIRFCQQSGWWQSAVSTLSREQYRAQLPSAV